MGSLSVSHLKIHDIVETENNGEQVGLERGDKRLFGKTVPVSVLRETLGDP